MTRRPHLFDPSSRAALAPRRAGIVTFVIDTADEWGVPTSAHCDACEAQWERPPGDDYATPTLHPFVVKHRDHLEGVRS